MNARTAAINLFERSFGSSPAGVVRSPGRVNLMGDHTDYNNGFALPMAIELSTWVAFAATDTDIVEIVSDAEVDMVRYSLSDDQRTGGWGNYAQGTTRAIGSATGFRAAISTDLPIGAGLSSSASLELAIAKLAAELDGIEWDPMRMALAGQHAENEWVGVSTGLLDQISVSHAVMGAALLIDFESLDVTTVELPSGCAIVVLDGGSSRSLTGSEYGTRRSTCERAAARLGVGSLRDIGTDDLASIELPELEMKRVRHVVTENERVHRIVAAFEAKDAAAAGAIMVESHASLRDDYEVAGEAQDAVVAAALEAPGVHGARMTGGGFAGSAVALVAADAVDDFAAAVVAHHRSRDGAPPTVFASQPAGAVAIDWLDPVAVGDPG